MRAMIVAPIHESKDFRLVVYKWRCDAINMKRLPFLDGSKFACYPHDEYGKVQCHFHAGDKTEVVDRVEINPACLNEMSFTGSGGMNVEGSFKPDTHCIIKKEQYQTILTC